MPLFVPLQDGVLRIKLKKTWAHTFTVVGFSFRYDRIPPQSFSPFRDAVHTIDILSPHQFNPRLPVV